MDRELDSNRPIFPTLSKKRKMSDMSGLYKSTSHSKSNKIFQITARSESGGPGQFKKTSMMSTYIPRKFDINRQTLFQKPAHQMSVSKLGDDTTMDFAELSKSRPFSLEERNLNINDISFTRLLRSEQPDTTKSTIKSGMSHPPSFYEKDIEKWKNKCKMANKTKLQQYIDQSNGSKTER
jgi:hypothetical protein